MVKMTATKDFIVGRREYAKGMTFNVAEWMAKLLERDGEAKRYSVTTEKGVTCP